MKTRLLTISAVCAAVLLSCSVAVAQLEKQERTLNALTKDEIATSVRNYLADVAPDLDLPTGVNFTNNIDGISFGDGRLIWDITVMAPLSDDEIQTVKDLARDAVLAEALGQGFPFRLLDDDYRFLFPDSVTINVNVPISPSDQPSVDAPSIHEQATDDPTDTYQPSGEEYADSCGDSCGGCTPDSGSYGEYTGGCGESCDTGGCGEYVDTGCDTCTTDTCGDSCCEPTCDPCCDPCCRPNRCCGILSGLFENIRNRLACCRPCGIGSLRGRLASCRSVCGVASRSTSYAGYSSHRRARYRVAGYYGSSFFNGTYYNGSYYRPRQYRTYSYRPSYNSTYNNASDYNRPRYDSSYYDDSYQSDSYESPYTPGSYQDEGEYYEGESNGSGCQSCQDSLTYDYYRPTPIDTQWSGEMDNPSMSRLHAAVGNRSAARLADTNRSPMTFASLQTQKQRTVAPVAVTDRTRAMAAFSLGCDSFWKGDYQTALTQFDTAVELAGDDARFWYFKGLSEKALGIDDAVDSLARAVTLDLEAAPSAKRQISESLQRIQGRLRLQLLRTRQQMQKLHRTVENITDKVAMN